MQVYSPSGIYTYDIAGHNLICSSNFHMHNKYMVHQHGENRKEGPSKRALVSLYFSSRILFKDNDFTLYLHCDSESFVTHVSFACQVSFYAVLAFISFLVDLSYTFQHPHSTQVITNGALRFIVFCTSTPYIDVWPWVWLLCIALI